MLYSDIKERLKPYLVSRDQCGDYPFYHYQIGNIHVTIMDTVKTRFEDAGNLKMAIHKLDEGIIIEKDNPRFDEELTNIYIEIENKQRLAQKEIIKNGMFTVDEGYYNYMEEVERERWF